MDELVTWLRAQLDDDERKVAAMEREARRVQTAPIFQGHPPNWLAGVDIFVSPTRWRAEVEARRRILDARDESARMANGDNDHGMAADADAMDWCVKVLALPYADREGYREEWRP
jgi:hypothetical protein